MGPLAYQALLAFLALLAASVASYLVSYTNEITRELQAFTLLWGLLTAMLFIGRAIRGRPRRIAITGIVVLLLVVWAVFCGRPPDRAKLREAYISRLVAFRGTHYFWGGESHVGIDCSGLARVALCEAMLVRGIAEANPGLLGPELWRFWWNDLACRGMLAGTYSYTRKIGWAEELAEYSGNDLQPGDLAITGQGFHVLIYLGNAQWIQASPDAMKVVIDTALPDSGVAWFHMPMTFMRWTMLE
ncbi:MAG: NlpC/P60 family protein [Armatimonadota bacterium]